MFYFTPVERVLLLSCVCLHGPGRSCGRGLEKTLVFVPANFAEVTSYFLHYIVIWHSNEITSILNINDPSRLKVLPMSDDVIFVLQTDSSLHCSVENVDILDSRPKVATL